MQSKLFVIKVERSRRMMGLEITTSCTFPLVIPSPYSNYSLTVVTVVDFFCYENLWITLNVQDFSLLCTSLTTLFVLNLCPT